MLVRRLIRLLLQFTADIWKHRNTVLHGATREEQRQLLTKLIHSKVVEAFNCFHTNPSIISSRNRYLFEKKTLLQRLQGDDDALLGWLNTVEVAIATHEVEQAAARENAARFFQPFREAGRRRLQRQLPADTAFLIEGQSGSVTDAVIPNASEQIHSPSSKVSEQLAAEVPQFVQASRMASSSSIINPTFLFSDLDIEEASLALTNREGRNSSSASSIPGPGPFPTTILDI